MMKIENYIPDFYIEAVYQLEAEHLLAAGITCLLVDLDNTLIAWNQPEGTPELRAWLRELKRKGIQLMVVSNNNHQRVAKALAPFGLAFVSRAMKPFGIGIRRAIKQLQVDKRAVAMVGDQRMTDIRAAKRVGIKSILVQPLVSSDAWNTKFNRFREKRVTKKIIEQYGAIIWQKNL